jgi:Sigma-70 region 2
VSALLGVSLFEDVEAKVSPEDRVMANGKLASALQQLRRIIGAGSTAAESDGRLLEQFACQQDEAAFTEIVRRHGPMVLAVCRRVLRDSHDAEDAFQATFLVLARKATSIRSQRSVAGWLARVAHHLALAARLKAARRVGREREAMPMACTEPEPDLDRLEMRMLLDDELHRLPAKLHAPMSIGHARDGWSSSTWRESRQKRSRSRSAAAG